MPKLCGAIEDDDGAHELEIFLSHEANATKPVVRVAVRTTLGGRYGVFMMSVRTDEDGTTRWWPEFSDESPISRLVNSKHQPIEPDVWDGEDHLARALIDRVSSPIFVTLDTCHWHLYGADEGKLNVTFVRPEIDTQGLDPSTVGFNKNFARIADRRFVRALACFPVVGGELRVGTWFEVSEDDFEQVYDSWEDEERYLDVRIRGSGAVQRNVLGQSLFGAKVQLAPRTADQCLFVTSFEPPALAAAQRCPLTPDELARVHEQLAQPIFTVTRH